jgi:hypothetical protein
VIVAVIVGLVLFVGLPALAIWKALPEARRMARTRVSDPPLNLIRVMLNWSAREDAKRLADHQARQSPSRSTEEAPRRAESP